MILRSCFTKREERSGKSVNSYRQRTEQYTCWVCPVDQPWAVVSVFGVGHILITPSLTVQSPRCSLKSLCGTNGLLISLCSASKGQIRGFAKRGGPKSDAVDCKGMPAGKTSNIASNQAFLPAGGLVQGRIASAELFVDPLHQYCVHLALHGLKLCRPSSLPCGAPYLMSTPVLGVNGSLCQ